MAAHLAAADNSNNPSWSAVAAGDVLALLSPLQELAPGLYLVEWVANGWAALRVVIDDEATETIHVTDGASTLPAELLSLFMPIGLPFRPAS